MNLFSNSEEAFNEDVLPTYSQGIAMLVLSRKKDEKIIIGDSITLMVIEIKNDKVRLGIEAPKDVTVHREEVYAAIKAQSEHDSTNCETP
ncbi:Carbon storage regulator [Gimesia algae]|uniref:Translational regulator CsrA n=2 Tax=Gimesia algae TaxID=2527971 RepID=A0A517VFQ4_9PLAN|nr:Carbon storage regulator [Gimesia algae]